jgi:cyclic beta-1,2-glucan synthetase
MFVNTDIKDNVIIAKRRERNNQEGQVLYAGSFAEGNEFGNFQFETDRASFIGRGKNRINPSVIFKNRPLKGTVGAVLDPIIAQRRYLKVKAKSFGRINFIIGVAETIDMAIETSKKYLSEDAISRTFRMAFARNQVEMSYLNVNAEEVSLYEDLMRYIIN